MCTRSSSTGSSGIGCGISGSGCGSGGSSSSSSSSSVCSIVIELDGSHFQKEVIGHGVVLASELRVDLEMELGCSVSLACDGDELPDDCAIDGTKLYVVRRRGGTASHPVVISDHEEEDSDGSGASFVGSGKNKKKRLDPELVRLQKQLKEAKEREREAKGQLKETKGQLKETKGQLKEAKEREREVQGQLQESKGHLQKVTRQAGQVGSLLSSFRADMDKMKAATTTILTAQPKPKPNPLPFCYDVLEDVADQLKRANDRYKGIGKDVEFVQVNTDSGGCRRIRRGLVATPGGGQRGQWQFLDDDDTWSTPPDRVNGVLEGLIPSGTQVSYDINGTTYEASRVTTGSSREAWAISDSLAEQKRLIVYDPTGLNIHDLLPGGRANEYAWSADNVCEKGGKGGAAVAQLATEFAKHDTGDVFDPDTSEIWLSGTTLPQFIGESLAALRCRWCSG